MKHFFFQKNMKEMIALVLILYVLLHLFKNQFFHETTVSCLHTKAGEVNSTPLRGLYDLADVPKTPYRR